MNDPIGSSITSSSVVGSQYSGFKISNETKKKQEESAEKARRRRKRIENIDNKRPAIQARIIEYVKSHPDTSLTGRELARKIAGDQKVAPITQLISMMTIARKLVRIDSKNGRTRWSLSDKCLNEEYSDSQTLSNAVNSNVRSSGEAKVSEKSKQCKITISDGLITIIKGDKTIEVNL